MSTHDINLNKFMKLLNEDGINEETYTLLNSLYKNATENSIYCSLKKKGVEGVVKTYNEYEDKLFELLYKVFVKNGIMSQKSIPKRDYKHVAIGKDYYKFNTKQFDKLMNNKNLCRKISNADLNKLIYFCQITISLRILAYFNCSDNFPDRNLPNDNDSSDIREEKIKQMEGYLWKRNSNKKEILKRETLLIQLTNLRNRKVCNGISSVMEDKIKKELVKAEKTIKKINKNIMDFPPL